MKLLAIYDNNGTTLDRYTVITDVTDHSGQYFDALGLSYNPTEYNGYSQWSTVLKTTDRFNSDNKRWRTRCDLGRIIHFENLPAHIQAHIAQRLWGEQ